MSHIQTGAKYGMRTMNQSLLEAYKAKAVTWDVAITRSSDPEDMRRMAQRDGLNVV
jgi:twitching motility protein PilT